MKHIISALAIIAILTGCATSSPEKRCEHYVAIYEAYYASTQIGRPVSAKEAMGAAAAAIFLRAYCGWSPVVTRSGGGMVDDNGVLILTQP